MSERVGGAGGAGGVELLVGRDPVAVLAGGRHRHLLIALDFDGVLAPLGDDPMGVRLAPGAHDLLHDVAAHPERTLALVSGRPADDLVALAGAPVGTLIAASHGAQQGVVTPTGLDLEALVLDDAETALLTRIGAALEEIAASAAGAWVEHKPLARVLHTRLAEPDAAARTTAAAVAGPASWDGVHALVGKSVVEIAVRGVTKADGVAWARARAAAAAGVPTDAVAVVFAGDDTTDEHALASLGPGDVGIKVGPGDTAAHVRVPDEPALVRYLTTLLS